MHPKGSPKRPETLPMRPGITRLRRIVLAALVFVMAPRGAWPAPIHIGTISLSPAEEVATFLPFATYLATHLRSAGIDEGKVVVARNFPEMAAFLREGKVDLFIGTPFPSLVVSRLSGSRFLLRRWKGGVAEYRSVVFTTTDSPISRLEDLKGEMIAFEYPHSTVGYFLPKLALIQQGLTPVPKNNAGDRVGPGEVGYVMSGDDANTLVWVLKGRVSAGAMDEAKYMKNTRENQGRLKVIHQSPALPRHIVSVRAGLSRTLEAQIKAILLRMSDTEDGRKTLAVFEKTARFDEIPDGATRVLLDARQFIDAEMAGQ